MNISSTLPVSEVNPIVKLVSALLGALRSAQAARVQAEVITRIALGAQGDGMARLTRDHAIDCLRNVA